MWCDSRPITRTFFLLLSGLALLAGVQEPRAAGPPTEPRPQMPSAQATTQNPSAKPRPRAHSDHNPKHGGIFFMSADYKHHLEGILLPSGTFRIYLYDVHTKALTAEETKKTSGTLQVGDAEDAPKIKLVPGPQAETLEAKLGNGLKLPVSVAVFLRLPGMAADARPELFNFKFTQFTDERLAGNCNPMANMPNMPC